jgi:hypothetical protein
MTNYKKLPIKSDNFTEVRESGQYYADKTMLIAEFLNISGEVEIITRPGGFGKTMNITMMRDFFDCTKDTKTLFEGLAIMETEYANKINTVPVIFLSFKDCCGAAKEEFRVNFIQELLVEYRRYSQLFSKPDKPQESTENSYKKYALQDFYRMYELLESFSATYFDLSNALKVLIKAVKFHFNKYPLVLIDDYDHPILSSYEHGCHDEIRHFFVGFYGYAFEGHSELGRAVLTGIQRVAQDRPCLNPLFDNVSVSSVADCIYSQHFGFTAAETRELLKHYSLSLTPESEAMYGGYRIAGVQMYNPWSVIKYADTKTLEPYPISKSLISLIKDILENAGAHFKRDFNEFISDRKVTTVVDLTTSYTEYQSSGALWGLLVNAGCLTIEEKFTYEIFTLRMTNNEMIDDLPEWAASTVERYKYHRKCNIL